MLDLDRIEDSSAEPAVMVRPAPQYSHVRAYVKRPETDAQNSAHYSSTPQRKTSNPSS
jgi:hypothetical protein